MMEYKKQIDVKYTTDVLVIGGGPSGVAAAWAAAGAGSRVMIIDACGAFGGLGTLGRVPMFCQFTDNINFLAGGFGKLIHDTCMKTGAVSPDDPYTYDKKNGSISILSERLKRIYDDLMVERGVQISFFTKVIDVVTTSGHIDYVVCSGQSSMFAITAQTYIDCTGDGVVSYYAGAEWEMGDENGDVQASTLCSVWTDIDWEKAREYGHHGLWPSNDQYLEQAFTEGVLKVEDRHLSGMWRIGETTGGGNIGHVYGIKGTDEAQLTRGMLEGRRLLEDYRDYYNRYLKGFENATLIDTGSLLGIRETRRIKGEYMLTADDFFRKATFDDEIGRYNYSIDAHPSSTSKAADAHFRTWFKKGVMQTGESYGIPYRCLTPVGFDNLLVAGRAISCDHYMQASVRVMPGCFITGQAAGMAASLAVREKTATNQVDVKELRDELRKIGAFFH